VSNHFLKNDRESDERVQGANQYSKSRYAQATTAQALSPVLPIERDQLSPDKAQIDVNKLMNSSENEFSKENHIVRNISL